MPHLTVTTDQLKYGGVIFRRGDKFFASEHDARLLKGFGKAGDYRAKVMTADDDERETDVVMAVSVGAHPCAEVEIVPPPRKKRAYRRRDLKAER